LPLEFGIGQAEYVDQITISWPSGLEESTSRPISANQHLRMKEGTVHSSTGTDVQTACDFFVWIDGNTYTEDNNTATDTITNSVGCDSIVTLDLKVNYSNTGIDIQSACTTFEWIDGNIYTESNNTATYALANTLGCDSIVTLDLTIINSNTGIDIQTACDSFDWIDGNTYTESNNTATYTLSNVAGCDSVVTLNLTINNSNTGIDIQTACNSFVWINGNTYTESNNTATYTLTNVAGCDSVVTLDLIINTIDLSLIVTDTSITAVVIGATYRWLDCGNNFTTIAGETAQIFTATENGDYAVEITENGCIDTSECITISTVSISENDLKNKVSIYPNPNNGVINIDLGHLEEVTIIVLNANNQLIYKKENINTSIHQFELNEAPGVYIIELYSSGKIHRYKLILE